MCLDNSNKCSKYNSSSPFSKIIDIFPTNMNINRDLPQSERAKYGILDNLVRFSFGVEDFEDLKADILQALEMI